MGYYIAFTIYYRVQEIMLKEGISIIWLIIIILVGSFLFIVILNRIGRYNMYKENILGIYNNNMPTGKGELIYFIIAVIVPFINLGSAWWEWAIKIIGFLIALTLASTIYTYLTDLVEYGNSRFKRTFHFLLLLLFPLTFYFAVKIYFL